MSIEDVTRQKNVTLHFIWVKLCAFIYWQFLEVLKANAQIPKPSEQAQVDPFPKNLTKKSIDVCIIIVAYKVNYSTHYYIC
jgi:hypothetical protein